MKKTVLLTCFSLLFASLQAQDPIFSQFFAAPLQLNPAFAGTTLAPRFSFNYRHQYPSFDNTLAYSTYGASFEQEVERLNSGFGLLLLGDAAGDGLYRTTQVSAIYGYKVQLTRDYFVRFGLEAGLLQARVDWNRLLFEDQLDRILGRFGPTGDPFLSEEERPDVTSATLFDASAGVLFYGKGMYAGVSLKHMNRPNISFLGINENLFSGLPMRLTVHAGSEIDLGKRNKRGDRTFISPNVMYVKQGDTGQVMAGSYFGAGIAYGGAWFRHNFTLADAVVISGGVRSGPYRIGYSYDFTVSDLAGTGNTHEIAVVVNLEDSPSFRRKRFRPDINNCFKMFQ